MTYDNDDDTDNSISRIDIFNDISQYNEYNDLRDECDRELLRLLAHYEECMAPMCEHMEMDDPLVDRVNAMRDTLERLGVDTDVSVHDPEDDADGHEVDL